MAEFSSIDEPESAKFGGFSRFSIPLIKRAYPPLPIAQILTSVQPMKSENAPAPADIIGAICLWIEEEFDAAIDTNYQTGTIILEFNGLKFGFRALHDKIDIGSKSYYYEDPNLFDQLRKIIKGWKSKDTNFDRTNHWQVMEDAKETTFFEC